MTRPRIAGPGAHVLEQIEVVRCTGRGASTRCPVHADRHASLSIGRGRDGRILLHCHAGCETETILTALGQTWADLFTTPRARLSRPSMPIVCELDTVRQAFLARERRLAERRARWADVVELADEAKAVDRLVLRARQIVTDLGDVPAAWDLAAMVAERETMMRNAEVVAHMEVAGHPLW